MTPDWLIERLVAGELPADRAADVRRRLEGEVGGAARLQQIAESNAEILAAHPPALIAARVASAAARRDTGAHVVAEKKDLRSTARRRKHQGWLFAFAAPTLAMAALGLAFWLRPVAVAPVGSVGSSIDRVGAGDDSDRIKGLRPGLHVYRKVGDAVEPLADGAPARAGNQLQLAYIAAGRRFGVVLSVDGAGHVTFHLPVIAGPAARLRSDGEVALPDAYELDAAPGFERFIFVAGNAPFNAAALADVARGTSPPPAGTSVVSFTVRKE
jgi:hypothetical protein